MFQTKIISLPALSNRADIAVIITLGNEKLSRSSPVGLRSPLARGYAVVIAFAQIRKGLSHYREFTVLCRKSDFSSLRNSQLLVKQ